MQSTHSQPKTITHYVDKFVHISSTDRDLTKDKGIYKFTIPFNDVYRQIIKVELIKTNLFIEGIEDGEILLTIKELPGNLSSGNPVVNGAFCSFSHDFSSNYLLQDNKTCSFPVFEVPENQAISGLRQLSIVIHSKDNKSSYVTTKNTSQENDLAVARTAIDTLKNNYISSRKESSTEIIKENWGSFHRTIEGETINADTLHSIATADNHTHLTAAHKKEQCHFVFKLTYAVSRLEF